MKIKLNDDLLLKLLLLFPITVLLQRYNFIPNRILFITIIILLINRIYIIIFKRRKEVLMLFLFILISLFTCTVYDIVKTRSSLININDCMYLPFWVLFLLYVTINYNNIKDIIMGNLPFIKKVFVISNVLIFLFYAYEGKGYFLNGRHRMASGCFLLVVEVIYYCIKKKSNKEYIYTILPIIATLNSTSRTYVVMTLLLLVYAYWNALKNKIYFYITIIPIGAVAMLIILNSPIAEFFKYRQVGDFDYMGSVTSGRTVFWEADINAFKKYNYIDKLFGKGYNEVYLVNKKTINTIYAHNDFINILMANGFIGEIYYLLSFIIFLKNILKSKKINFLMSIIVVFIIFFNAFFNGQYNYPAATFSMVFLFDLPTIKERRKK